MILFLISHRINSEKNKNKKISRGVENLALSTAYIGSAPDKPSEALLKAVQENNVNMMRWGVGWIVI